MQLLSIKCPDCGAVLPIEEGKTLNFCQYCGARVLLHNENEFIHRNIDETKIKELEVSIKEAEAYKAIELKKLEMQEKENANIERRKRFRNKACCLLIFGGFFVAILAVWIEDNLSGRNSITELFGVLGILSFILGIVIFNLSFFMGIFRFFAGDIIKSIQGVDDGSDKIRIPMALNNINSTNYAAVENIFQSAGFTNIKCVPLNDLTFGVMKKPGMVESITVNGKNVTMGGRRFSPDVAVVISYHSFAEKR